MNFINLTPHALTILDAEGGPHGIPSHGIARVGTARAECPPCGPFRVISQEMGDITGLPDPLPGTIFVVSTLVLAALKDEVLQGLRAPRNDVFSPDTGADAVRENGQIVAVRGLVC